MFPLQHFVALISAALECSIYLAPDAPGLTHEELIEVGSQLGHQQGEINDALDWPQAHVETRNGRWLPATPIMAIYYNFHHKEEPDYRPAGALNFLHAQLADRAKVVGARNTRIERNVLIERALQLGIQRIDIEAAMTLALLSEVMVEQDGMIRFVTGKAGFPSPEQQRSQLAHNPGRMAIPKPERARVYPIVKDIVARRSDGRPMHAEPFAAFAEQLGVLGYGQFRMWWAQMVAELLSASGESRSVSVCVLAAALVEGALTFVVKHAQKLDLAVFRSSDFAGEPHQWTINKLVASAASGGPSAILDSALKAHADILCKTRQRIHAGRMLSDHPTGVPDLKPEAARKAKLTAELVVRRIVEWLAVYPSST